MIALTPITVFVGPNNSGKSKVLTEVYQYCQNGQPNVAALLVDRVTLKGLTAAEAENAVGGVQLAPRFGEALLPDHIIVGKKNTRHQVSRDQLLQCLQAPAGNPSVVCTWYLSYNTLMLDGSSRITLIGQQVAGDLQQPANTSFQQLFRNDTRRAELRRIVHEAFGSHLVIDPTHLGHLRLRLAPREPVAPSEERGIDAAAVAFHAAAQPIEHGSDGVKAFTGIMTEVIAGDPSVLLIDEPEAFLHPSLAYKLGLELVTATAASSKRVFVSTHSPQFLMGCIQAGVPLNIVRLTYRDSVATARVLPSRDIVRLMRNPLLRSTGVISGLFYEFVVVTESDADRAFYQEVNERLLRKDPNRGIPNCLFLNAQNRQTVHQIIGPLRELGIPAAAIVDIDVLKEGGTAWTNLLTGAHVPAPAQPSLAGLRASVKSLFDATGRDMKREGGVDLLTGAEKEAATHLFDQLDEYGVFAVRRGELESWLPALGAAGHGPGWLVEVFEGMGEDPGQAGYVFPGDDDVWAFIGALLRWLANPTRKGIPT